MNVVVTGGGGFLGSRLARVLLAARSLDVAGGGARPLARVTLASPAKAVEALLCAATSSFEVWGGRTAVTMPALTVTVADMAAALRRVAGPQAGALIDWVPDPAVARMVATWPARIRAERAARLGLAPDRDFESVIRMHLAEAGP